MSEASHTPSLALVDPTPELVFASARCDEGLELRINFGLFAGRDATPAEIDVLGQALLARVEPVTIVSEQRYEIGTAAEGTLHQVVVTVEPQALPQDITDQAEIRGRLLEVSERWAEACITDRHNPLNNDLQDLL
jgi:hypothetical protein